MHLLPHWEEQSDTSESLPTLKNASNNYAQDVYSSSVVYVCVCVFECVVCGCKHSLNIHIDFQLKMKNSISRSQKEWHN